MINYSVMRGDIVIFDFGTNNGNVQGGVRPAVALQSNAQSPVTIIAPLTTELKKPQMPAHVILGKRFGLRESSMVLLEQLVTVNKSSLGPYIGHIDDPQVMRLIDQGLCKTLGIQSKSCCSDDASSEEVPV